MKSIGMTEERLALRNWTCPGIFRTQNSAQGRAKTAIGTSDSRRRLDHFTAVQSECQLNFYLFFSLKCMWIMLVTPWFIKKGVIGSRCKMAVSGPMKSHFSFLDQLASSLTGFTGFWFDVHIAISSCCIIKHHGFFLLLQVAFLKM